MKKHWTQIGHFINQLKVKCLAEIIFYWICSPFLCFKLWLKYEKTCLGYIWEFWTRSRFCRPAWSCESSGTARGSRRRWCACGERSTRKRGRPRTRERCGARHTELKVGKLCTIAVQSFVRILKLFLSRQISLGMGAGFRGRSPLLGEGFRYQLGKG
jgi:hypothetical protein